MRRLIYIPMVHTVADMGSEAENLKGLYIARNGEEEWLVRNRVVEKFWDEIEKRVFSMELDFSRVRIYQDGLPVSGKELQIMKEVAAQGSRNYRIVQELVEKGAALEGTEDPRLLLAEYRAVKIIAAVRDEAARQRANVAFALEAQEILKARDAFVGQRIDQTLQDGETGLLFMGLLHQVEQYLPSDIQVEYLVHRLPLSP